MLQTCSNQPKHVFADVCRKSYVHCSTPILNDSKRAWFKLAMLMQHLSSPWIPRGLVVLRSVLALFGTDQHIYLCSAQGGATFLCRSSRTHAGRTLSKFGSTHPARGPHAYAS